MKFLSCITTFIFLPFLLAAQGTISGTLLDANNGEPLMFANVVIEGTSNGNTTDMDGKYQILNLDSGTYNLVASYVGYQDKKVEGVEVKDGEVTYMDIMLSDQTAELSEVVVTAKALERSENALMMLQKKSDKIQDGISSQEMSRYSIGDAAGAMKKVTGASVQGGKYIYIRGLGDRYSISQLNGLIIPSTDPYRNGAQLDLIPTNLLDNIVTSKTFTPDQPGMFTGGNVDIKTKSFPEQFSLKFAVSTAYNSQNNLVDDFLTHEGGKSDYFGYDDGGRARTDELIQAGEVEGTLTSQAPLLAGLNIGGRGKGVATAADDAIRSLNTDFVPTEKTTPLDHSYSLSFGNQYSVGGRPLGVIFAGSFKQNYQHLNNFQKANWRLDVLGSERLRNMGDFTETKSTETPTVNGIVGLAYKLSDSDELTFNVIYNHTATKESRFVEGERPDNIIAPDFLEGRSLSFQERALLNYQLGGSHVFSNLNQMRVEWKTSFVNSSMLEPNTRFFENQYNEDFERYTLPASNIQRPFHFFRELDDTQADVKLDITLPFTQNSANKIKFGGLMTRKDREFHEYRYQVEENVGSTTAFTGDPAAYLSSDNIGIIGMDDTGERFTLGNYIVDRTSPLNSYTGHDYTTSAYAMVNYSILENLKFIGGARVEKTDIFVESEDETADVGEINAIDVLPSANLVYSLTPDMNLRAAFSQTIARPNMREIAPFGSYDPIEGLNRLGNPDLKRTNIQNFDLRLEWFPKAGEIFAVSGYYKDFKNPIVQSYLKASSPEIQFTNVDGASLYGVEFEVRKNLDVITPALKDFKVATNISLIQSSSDVQNETGLEPENRPFEGQPTYIANVALIYENRDHAIDGVLTLNTIGDRLNIIGREGTPDIYERGRAQLDFSLSKKFGDIGVNVTAKNLLNAKYTLSSDYNDQEFVYYNFTRGITFGFGVSYTLR